MTVELSVKSFYLVQRKYLEVNTNAENCCYHILSAFKTQSDI